MTESPTGEDRPRSRAARLSGNVLVFAFITLSILALVEGFSSLILFGWEASRVSDVPSQVHAQYDTLLGWVNRPNVRLPDLYGEGKSLTTNERSFRGTKPLPDVPAAGRIRLVCSGDSFTLGHGVGDEETWCALLERLDPRLETVNLGHAGYGIDQSYLLYEREASSLAHDVHVFAFIYDDFRRMGLRDFLSRPKPVLELRDGRPVAVGVPVPHRSRLAKWQVNAGVFMRLRSLELGQRALARISGRKQPRRAQRPEDHIPLALAAFEEVAALDRSLGVRTLFVYLDMSANESRPAAAMGRLLEREMSARGLPFADLRTVFRALPHDSLHTLFDPEWQHYSSAGNRLVAGLLYERLEADSMVGPPAAIADLSEGRTSRPGSAR
ncbi:MAG TPA: hypothetical protein VFZ24_08835 [Longimicrobiales bacterium]